MILKNFIISITILLTVVLADTKQLNPDLFNVWTVEEVGLRELIRESVEYYIEANPSDTLILELMPYDKIIVIESKKMIDKIFEIRYGNRGKLTPLDADQVKWIFSKKLRQIIIEKDYFYIHDAKFFKNPTNSSEMDYIDNDSFWTNRDIQISLGSRVIIDKAIIRLTNLGGIQINPIYAFSFGVGNEIIGYPNVSLGTTNIGLLNKYFEIGIQTPIPDVISDNYSRFLTDDEESLQGAIGGFGAVSLFGLRAQFSFSELINNKFVIDNLHDTSYVDHMSISLSGVGNLFKAKLDKYGVFVFRGGLGYYKISHREIDQNGHVVERFKDKSNNSYDDSFSSFIGPIIRIDYLSRIKSNSNNLPSLQSFLQFNGYEGDLSVLANLTVHKSIFGISLTYKNSFDAVDWAPNNELYLNFSVAFNQIEE